MPTAEVLDVTAPPERPKPAFRGVSHEIAALAMVVVGPILGLSARGVLAELCCAVYAFCLTAMLSVSALFHRVTWSTPARRRMRRLDHSTIFLAIAGTYTAIAGLALPGADRVIVVSMVWAGAVGGIVLRLVWLDAPKWAVALPYLALGWVAAAIVPELLHSTGGVGLTLLITGGAFYTLGAVVYAKKRPDPWPSTFGYHEIFHACVIVALTLHFCLVAFVILPRH